MNKTAMTLALLGLPLASVSSWAQMESAPPEMSAGVMAPADASTPSDDSVSAPVTSVAPEDAVMDTTAAYTLDAATSTEDYPDMSKASPALAKRFYIAPMFDYTFADKDRNSDNGLGGRLVIGKQIADGFNIEISGLYERYKGEQGGKEQLTGGGIGVLAFPSTTFSGFFGSAGVNYGKGKSDVSTTPNSDKRSTLWNLGLGYLVGPIGWLNDGGLRLEARYQIDEKNVPGTKSDFMEPVLSAGLLVPLGAAPQPPPPVEQPVAVVPLVAPSDTDGDGVVDASDQCPDTPAGTQVNDVGCPLPPPCKPPEAGQRVDLSGCAVGDTIVLHGVNFEFDKAKLTVNAQTILDGVADALVAASDVRVEVDGHTDSKGSDDYNQRLSESRAQSVMQYLGEHGVAADRMSAVGLGETQPIADNDSEEGRELNRRVELRITGAAAPVSGSASLAPVADPVADSAATPPADDFSTPADDMSAPSADEFAPEPAPTDPQSFDPLTGP